MRSMLPRDKKNTPTVLDRFRRMYHDCGIFQRSRVQAARAQSGAMPAGPNCECDM